MAETRLRDSGYKRVHRKVCDFCRSEDLRYDHKGWVRCNGCGKLYSRKHKFDVEVE